MYYDRKEVKRAARAIIRETRPKPMWITFAYLMLVSLVSFVLMMLCMVPNLFFLGALANGYLDPAGTTMFVGGMPFLFLFVYILVALYAMVMQFGYAKYALTVKRGQPSGLRDLFSGFSRVGRVLMMNLLIGVFTFLWSLVSMAIIMIPMGIAAVIGSDAIMTLAGIVSYFACLAFLLNRTLRYAPAFFVMADHPELTAREALNESKAIMRGNVWKLFVFEISFIGWGILCLLIAYSVLIPGMLLTGFVEDPTGAVIPFILVCIVAFVATAFLAMWVNAYQSVAFAGFYDAVNGFDSPAAPVDELPPTIPTFIPPVIEPAAPAVEDPIPVAEPEPSPEETPETPAEDGDPEL